MASPTTTEQQQRHPPPRTRTARTLAHPLSVPFLRRRRSTMSAAARAPPPSTSPPAPASDPDPAPNLPHPPAAAPVASPPRADRAPAHPGPARQLLRRGRTVLRARRRSEHGGAAPGAGPPDAGARGARKRRGPDAGGGRGRALLARKGKAEGARPAHHRAHGFANPWASAGGGASGGLSGALRARAAGAGSRTFFKVARERPLADEVVAAMLLLADRPDLAAGARALAKDPRALATVWLGHCTLLLRARGLAVLTDPVWAPRLGPLGARRAVPPVLAVEDVPPVDVALLSSAHYDHLDRAAAAALVGKVGRWLVPLGLRAPLVAAGVPAADVVEADWWQEVEVAGARFVCTPAQHSSGSRDDALWCSWAVLAPGHRFFYCGGTGYRALDKNIDDCESFEHRAAYGGPACPAFKQVAEKFGRFDTALLPLGGYKPRGAMATVQGDPVDMLFVHKDLRARRSIAHRWGTYAAPGESLLDPVRALEAAIVTSPVPEHEFTYLKHGKLHIT